MRFLSSSIMMSICLIICTHNTQAQSFYKWIDAEGSTHYTLTPPPKTVQNMGQVKTYDGPPPPLVIPSTNTTTPPTSTGQEATLLPDLTTMNPVDLANKSQHQPLSQPPINTQAPVNKSPNKSYIPLPPPQAGAQASYY